MSKHVLVYWLAAAALVLAAGCSDRETDSQVRDTGGDLRDSGDDSTPDTSDGGGDTTPDVPLPDQDLPDLDPGALTIYDVQDEASPDHPSVDSTVTVRGRVTAIDRFQFQDNPITVGSFWIQDPTGGPFSGIYIFNLGGNDVDITDLQLGQTVDVTGNYTEFNGLSEIQVDSMVVVDAVARPLAPETVEPGDVATDGADAEAYEGVLVQVLAVEVTANDIGFGKFEIEGGLEIDDELTAFPAFPNVGQTYDRIAGVLTYFEGVQLNPRDANDIEGEVEVPGVTIYDIQDESSDDHPTLGSTVTVTGVVTGIDTFANNTNDNNASNFWVQDADGGPYSGLFVYTTRGTRYDVGNLQVGYTVSVTGTTAENFDQTQIVLAQDGVEILDTESTPLEPEVVLPADVATGGDDQEAYEGVLIRVENVTFDRQLTESDESGPGDRTNHFFIDDDLIVANTFFTLEEPAAATQWTHIDGPLTWAFNRSRIAPRSAADLVEAE